MKKKLMALLLCLAMATTMLAACGGGGEAGGNGDEIKASVFWYEESDVYLSTVRTALNKELDAAGIKYDNQFAGNDQAKQIDQIKTAIAGGTNLLIVNIVTSGAPDTAQDIIDAAGDIPVIFFNRASVQTEVMLKFLTTTRLHASSEQMLQKLVICRVK